MSASFSVSAFEGEVFFLDGRFSSERRDVISSFVRQYGGNVSSKFDPTVTIVLQDERRPSTYPEPLIRTIGQLIDLLGLRQCDPSALFEDEVARHRLHQLPAVVIPPDFVLEVREASWNGRAFRGHLNAESSVPWQIVESSFNNCHLEHIHIIGSLAGPGGRLAVEGGRITDCTIRQCQFSLIEKWIADRVAFEDTGATSLSRCILNDVQWLRGSLPRIVESSARSLVIEGGQFPSITASELINCKFARLGHDDHIEAAGNNLRRTTVAEGTLKDCLLSEVRLDHLQWEGVTLCDLTFQNCEFKELVFSGCRLSGCRFQNVSAGILDFTDCEMKNCVWEGVVPRIFGLPAEANSGIEWPLTDPVDALRPNVVNLRAIPELTDFCEMFVARDNVKLNFNAVTIGGTSVAVQISKLRYWEFSAIGEGVSFQMGLDDSCDKSIAAIARLFARLFQEVGIRSVDPRSMKVKMTALSAKTPVISAAEFKRLALKAFDGLSINGT